MRVRVSQQKFFFCHEQERGEGVRKKERGNYYMYTQRNLFEILLNQPEIELYLPFSD